MENQINLSVKDIYSKLCSNCKKKLIDMIKDRIATETVKKQLESKE